MQESSTLPLLSGQIFIDASTSMEGYVRPQPTTRYIRVLQDLQGSFVTAWPRAAVTFYQFGAGVSEVKDQAPYAVAARPSFYRGPLSKETRISLVFQKVTPRVLTLLVTDLFQSDADVAAMVKALADVTNKYNVAVAIVAARSEFDGTVYDVGPHNLHFSYRSRAAKPDTFRPFYILVIGNEPDVRRYLNQLRRDSDVIKSADSRVLMLSSAGAAGKGALGPEEFMPCPGVVTTNNFINCSQPGLTGLLVRDRLHRLTLTQRLPSTADTEIPHSMLEKATLSVVGRKSSDGKKWTAFDGADAVRSDFVSGSDNACVQPAQRQMPAAHESKGGNSQSARVLAVSIDPVKLNGPESLWGFQLVWTAGPDAFEQPGWCQQWDMDISRLETWVKQPESFDGSKTLNLARFIGNLWTTMIQDKPPEIGRLYVYVKR